eukprot:SAG11_NODE_3_length_39220_cov_67.005828_17_plen_163_part_00
MEITTTPVITATVRREDLGLAIGRTILNLVDGTRPLNLVLNLVGTVATCTCRILHFVYSIHSALLYVCLALLNVFAQCTESTTRLHNRVQHAERIPKLVAAMFLRIFSVCFFSFNFRNFCSDFPWQASKTRIFKNLRQYLNLKWFVCLSVCVCLSVSSVRSR